MLYQKIVLYLHYNNTTTMKAILEKLVQNQQAKVNAIPENQCKCEAIRMLEIWQEMLEQYNNGEITFN